MALPLAAIAAAAQTAMQIGGRAMIQRSVAQASGSLASKMATATLVMPGVISGASSSVLSTVVGKGNVIPGVPTMSQFQQGLARMGMADGTKINGVPTFFSGVGFRRRGRRMNVANVKALRRAGRRVEGFVKLAKSLIAMPGARAKHPIKRRKRR